MDELKRLYTFKTKTGDEERELLDKLHCQLAGNNDYVKNNIVLNDSSARGDGTLNEVRVYIFEECEVIPSLVLY